MDPKTHPGVSDATAPAPAVEREIRRYLSTGETDPRASAWPGATIVEQLRNAHRDLRAALLEEVRRRTPAGFAEEPVASTEVTRRRVDPMVRGLFPPREREIVLRGLEGAVVFVTAGSLPRILESFPFHRSAWDAANLFLGSVGAPLLGDEAPEIVGFSEGTTCYLSTEYLRATGPFEDFLVHEVAHVFHNCKRRTLGLQEKRRSEWLLPIAFRKRETFAYACEVYARIAEQARGRTERRAMARRFAELRPITDGRIDPGELAGIVLEAAEARAGWRAILRRCSG